MNVTVFEAINITKRYRNTLALNQVSIRNLQSSVIALAVLLRALLFILI